MYCFLLGENLQEGIVGFGETPFAAAVAFDEAFMRKKINIPEGVKQ
jgi:hypothetical protein